MCATQGFGRANQSDRLESGVRTGPNSEKMAAYAEIVTYVYDLIVASDSWVTDLSRKESAQRLGALVPQVTAWGSEKVVRAFLDLRQAADAYAIAPSLLKLGDQFRVLEGLLLAVRADLGYADSGLEREYLLRLCVSELGRYLEQTGFGYRDTKSCAIM